MLKLLALLLSILAAAEFDGCEVDQPSPSKAGALLQLKDDQQTVEEDSGFFDCRRRRRRRRRQVNTLNKKCWYQVWWDSAFEGSWMNYEMSAGLCDDLSTWNGGSWNNKASSGMGGATPGCQLKAHDATACSGTGWEVADATSSGVAVTKVYNNFDSAWSDKISSFYCSCSSSLVEEGEAGHVNGTRRSGGSTSESAELRLEDAKTEARHEEGTSSEDMVEEDSKIVNSCRRRRRRRRRQVNTLNKKCWYQVWWDSAFEGSWMNYEMSAGLCDDLSTWNGGSWNNKASSGMGGATPGCQLKAHDATACSGTGWEVADATSSGVAVTKVYNNFDSAWSDKISSFYCSCSSSLVEEGEAEHVNGTRHSGGSEAEEEQDEEDWVCWLVPHKWRASLCEA